MTLAQGVRCGSKGATLGIRMPPASTMQADPLMLYYHYEGGSQKGLAGLCCTSTTNEYHRKAY